MPYDHFTNFELVKALTVIFQNRRLGIKPPGSMRLDLVTLEAWQDDSMEFLDELEKRGYIVVKRKLEP